MGGNSITQTTHKTMPSTFHASDQIVQALSLFFAQYATKS